jgi:hypothetical protein
MNDAPPPPIVRARFEFNDEVLATYDAAANKIIEGVKP